MKENYKISVVMAVYNVAPFLEEAVNSLTEQDIGFGNIQLILVDDGSTDGSAALCDGFSEKYPENVEVYHKENGGVSSARNLGLEHVRGRYVNFLDSDDKLSTNACRLAYDFMEENGDKTDLVSLPMCFFDGNTGEHTLNYKYKNGTRVIDLHEEWDAPQLSFSSCFAKSSSLMEKKFETRLAYAEDAQLLQKILIEKCSLGVLSDAKYWYRKRSCGEQSALQKSESNRKYYLPNVRFFTYYTVHNCLDKLQYVPKFIQNTLMYDLQWRIKQAKIPTGVITEKEKKEYISKIFEVVQCIDDDVIWAQKNITDVYKQYIICEKYYGDFNLLADKNGIGIYKDHKQIFDCSKLFLELDFITLSASAFTLEGRLFDPFHVFSDFSVRAVSKREAYESTTERINTSPLSLGTEVADVYALKVSGKPENSGRITFWLEKDGVSVQLTNIGYGKFFPLSTYYPHSYYSCSHYVLTGEGSFIQLKRTNFWKNIGHELSFLRDLASDASEEEHIHAAARKALFVRPIVLLLKKLKRRPIWLLSDRLYRADDNGKAFFAFLRENHREINAVFFLDKNCKDMEELKKIGPVVAYGSTLYKLLYLSADYNISSAEDEYISYPFQGHREAYKNLMCDVKFVFLQHGVTKDDISSWVNRYNKNIFALVTSAEREYLSFLNDSYYYHERNVWLTGMPRYDRLIDDSQKIITIMPTWRQYLTEYTADGTNEVLNDSFKNSDYYIFYNGLLNNEKLISAAKKYGYKLQFFPHPTLQKNLRVFDKNEAIVFLAADISYRDVYAQSSLVVTDYSSAVFDFAYLKKPVIYAQFDEETFFRGNHTYTKGYFSYENDGFGEVEYDLASVVDRIIEYMQNGCVMKEKYAERVDSFFSFHDRMNCERIYVKMTEAESSAVSPRN